MLKSDSIGALAAALAKAQKAFKPAIKDANNPFFKSKYVDLSGAIDAIRDALADNGLSVVQSVDSGDKLTLQTTLMHSSGEWIASVYPITAAKQDPQGIGSAVTYARRYSLMALVGLAAEDDDGEAAEGRQHKIKQTSSGETRTRKTSLSPEQEAEIGTMNKEILDYGGEASLTKSAEIQRGVAYDDAEVIMETMRSYHAKVLAWAEKQGVK